jgi:hypothetical protein
MGDRDLEEAAAITGRGTDGFRKSLDRRKADFRSAMKATECE